MSHRSGLASTTVAATSGHKQRPPVRRGGKERHGGAQVAERRRGQDLHGASGAPSAIQRLTNDELVTACLEFGGRMREVVLDAARDGRR